MTQLLGQDSPLPEYPSSISNFTRKNAGRVENEARIEFRSPLNHLALRLNIEPNSPDLHTP
jgi:hypothetical protein